jgi:DNA-binding NarL/FixJ family response regulator
MITIGIVDDHQLFVKSLGLMLATFNNYKVLVEATNGKDVLEKMAVKKLVPDLMLIDVNMPIMDGYQTTLQLKKLYPTIKLVALSMNDEEDIIINMIKAGCCGYLLKDTHPNELEKALNEIADNGYYNGDKGNINFKRFLQSQHQKEATHFTDRELQFLQYACSDMTYKQIAGLMNLSERTIDGYREALFEKLKVQSRVGVCLEAVRRKLVKI